MRRRYPSEKQQKQERLRHAREKRRVVTVMRRCDRVLSTLVNELLKDWQAPGRRRFTHIRGLPKVVSELNAARRHVVEAERLA